MKNSPSSTRPRLLVLSSTFPRWVNDTEPGFIYDLCRHLVVDYDVTVLAPHAPGAKQVEMMAGLNVVRFRYGPDCLERLAYHGGIMANLRCTPSLTLMLPFFLLAEFAAIVHAIRRLRPVAVHAHWIVPQGLLLVAALAISRHKPRTVCTAHGSDVSALKGAAWTRVRRWVVDHCNQLVTVSEALRSRLKYEGCPAGKIKVIPMGVDLENIFVPDNRPRDPNEILFVGRLAHEKGLDILLHAMPDILERHTDAKLTVIGQGPAGGSLVELARQLGISEKVTFVGALAHEELVHHFRRAALLVLPSRAEGFGLVMIEALGCGCPVAATDLPAIRETLDEGRCAKLFRADDPIDLTQVVTALLADPASRRELAQAGRLHALAHYGWHEIAQHYADILSGNVGRIKRGANHA